MRRGKAQLRRTVSLSPRCFLALKAYSAATGEPMAAFADRVLVAAIEAAGVKVMTDDEACAEMRRIVKAVRAKDTERESAVEAARKEAFGC